MPRQPATTLMPTPHDRLRWKRTDAATSLREADVAAAWNRLNSARTDLPFLDSSAVLAALDVFGTGREQLLCGQSDGQTVAMLVVAPLGRMRWATFQPSQLPLGCWVADRGQRLETLADQIVRGPLGLCLAFSVTQVDPLMAPRPDDGPALHGLDYIDTGWIDIQGSFDDYWNARGKNLRQNMRKQRNKLGAEGVVARMQVLRAPEQMAAALERYGRLEAAGWKAGGGTAIEAGNPQGRFYGRLLTEAATRGEALVTEYLFDDRTVAMNLGLLRRGQLVVLKTTYDESIKSLSPAFLLREDELRSFHTDGEVRRVEFFGRMMEWHTRYTDSKRGIYHLTCYRWPWIKQLAMRQRAAAPEAAAEAVASKADT